MGDRAAPTIRTPHVVAACLGFLIGVGVASALFAWGGGARPVFAVAGMIAAAVLVGAARRHPANAVAVIAVVAAVIGYLRFAIPAQHEPTIVRPTATVIEGRVASARMRSSTTAEIRLVTTRMVSDRRTREGRRSGSGAAGTAFVRPIVVTTRNAMSLPRYGDTVRIPCTLLSPSRLRDRLTLDGRCTVQPAVIRIVSTQGGIAIVRGLLAFRSALLGRLDRALPDPSAGLAGGILLGEASGIPEDRAEAFRATGTIHVLVVSGWHMSFIGLRIRRTLLAFGIPRRLAIALVALLVAAFTVMVGLQAPAVRGALMVAAFLAVDLLGRMGNGSRVLLLIAAAMVLVAPEALAFDLGFQLSFAATAGIVLGAPIIERWLARRPTPRRTWRHELRALVAESVAASVATVPLIAGAFGAVSPLSPLVNIPVLLLILPFMATSAIALIAVGIPIIGAAATASASAIGDAMVATVEGAAGIPWVRLTIPPFDPWFVVGCELLLLLAALAWYRSKRIPVLSPFIERMLDSEARHP